MLKCDNAIIYDILPLSHFSIIAFITEQFTKNTLPVSAKQIRAVFIVRLFIFVSSPITTSL